MTPQDLKLLNQTCECGHNEGPGHNTGPITTKEHNTTQTWDCLQQAIYMNNNMTCHGPKGTYLNTHNKQIPVKTVNKILKYYECHT